MSIYLQIPVFTKSTKHILVLNYFPVEGTRVLALSGEMTNSGTGIRKIEMNVKRGVLFCFMVAEMGWVTPGCARDYMGSNCIGGIQGRALTAVVGLQLQM